jgi:hypothetical protein
MIRNILGFAILTYIFYAICRDSDKLTMQHILLLILFFALSVALFFYKGLP